MNEQLLWERHRRLRSQHPPQPAPERPTPPRPAPLLLGDRVVTSKFSYSSDNPLVVLTSMVPWNGYGQLGAWVCRGLEAAGVPFACRAIDPAGAEVDPYFAGRMLAGPVPPSASLLAIGTPDMARPPRAAVALTMWETSRISSNAVDNLNSARMIIVPSRHSATALADSGVAAPARVIPLGVSASEGYTPAPLPDRAITFGTAARMAHGGVRKGVNEVMAAFADAFPPGVARLLVKVHPDCLPSLKPINHPDIFIIAKFFSNEEMIHWYRSIHVYVSGSKGEGWGLHPLQAMATGRPVIAAKHGGTSEYFDQRSGWELPFDMAPAGEFYAGLGEWAVPTHDGMVAAFRAAASNPAAIREKARFAAMHAQSFTYEHMGQEIAAALESIVVKPYKRASASRPACVFRERCTCTLTRCRHLDRPFGEHVSADDCRRCGGRPLRVGLGILVGPDAYMLPHSLPACRPFFDDAYALVDDRAGRDILGLLEANDIRYDLWNFNNQYVLGNNLINQRLRADWAFHIDTDETVLPQHLSMIRPLAEEGEAAGVGGYELPRRHWHDIAMTNEHTDWYPNLSPKLRRRDSLLDEAKHPVHPTWRPGIRVERCDIEIQHFNLALKSPEEFARLHEIYTRLDPIS